MSVKLHLPAYPGKSKSSWLVNAEAGASNAEWKEIATTGNFVIEQRGIQNVGNALLAFVAYYERDDYGTTERVIRHYYGFRNIGRREDGGCPEWQVAEYWMESYNLIDIEEEEDQEEQWMD